MAVNAKYKIFDGSSWVQYYFETSAAQVGTDGNRQFVSGNTKVNGVSFTLNSDGENASVTISGDDIVGSANAPTGHTLQYISASDNIGDALGLLDKAIYEHVPDLSGYLPLTAGSGKALTGDLYLGGNALRFGTSSNDYVRIYQVFDGADFVLTFKNTYNKYQFTGPSVSDGEGGTFVTNAILSTANLTTHQSFAFPNASGTLVVDSQIGAAASKGVATSISSSSTNNDLATAAAVYNALSALPTPMQFKGTLGTNGTITTLPAASSSNNGYMYKVITADTYQGVAAQVGDALVSDGTAWVLIPSGDESFTDTWREIKVNGTSLLGNAISTGSINFVNGGNITFTGSGNDITIGVASGYSIPSTTDQTSWSAKYDKPSGGIPDSDLATSYLPLSAGSTKALTGSLFAPQGIYLYNSVEAPYLYSNDPNVLKYGLETIAFVSQVPVVQAASSFSGTPKAGDIWVDTSN